MAVNTQDLTRMLAQGHDWGSRFAQSAGTRRLGSALVSSRAGIFRRAGFIMASISAGTSMMRCHTCRPLRNGVRVGVRAKPRGETRSRVSVRFRAGVRFWGQGQAPDDVMTPKGPHTLICSLHPWMLGVL